MPCYDPAGESVSLKEFRMYALVRRLSAREALLVEIPALAAALAVAEFFYKFHSFTLECLAFLATWLMTSAVAHAAVGRKRA